MKGLSWGVWGEVLFLGAYEGKRTRVFGFKTGKFDGSRIWEEILGFSSFCLHLSSYEAP